MRPNVTRSPVLVLLAPSAEYGWMIEQLLLRNMYIPTPFPLLARSYVVEIKEIVVDVCRSGASCRSYILFLTVLTHFLQRGQKILQWR